MASIKLNGREYDANTGRRLSTHPARPASIDGIVNHAAKATTSSRTQAHHARSPKKSRTLARAAVKKPKILMDVRHVPLQIETSKHAYTPTHQIERSKSITHFSPITATPANLKPAEAPKTTHAYHKHHAAEPSSSAEKHLQKQLAEATAHTAEPHRKKPHSKARSRRRRAMSFAGSTAALLLIGGFVAYNSLPGLSLTLANRRAGFDATLPRETPSGFKMSNPVAYGPGRVVLSYSTSTDQRRFKIEQTPTTQTTQSLKEEVARDNNNQYQTFEHGGLTIFFSGDNTATWIDGNVKYVLEGDSKLSSDQVANIASSM